MPCRRGSGHPCLLWGGGCQGSPAPRGRLWRREGLCPPDASLAASPRTEGCAVGVIATQAFGVCFSSSKCFYGEEEHRTGSRTCESHPGRWKRGEGLTNDRR